MVKGIQVRVSRWGDDPGGLEVLTRIFVKGKQEARERREKKATLQTQGGGRCHPSRADGGLETLEKAKQQILSFSLQKKHIPANTLNLDSDTRVRRINLF